MIAALLRRLRLLRARARVAQLTCLLDSLTLHEVRANILSNKIIYMFFLFINVVFKISLS
jgi:hypothetical protein